MSTPTYQTTHARSLGNTSLVALITSLSRGLPCKPNACSRPGAPASQAQHNITHLWSHLYYAANIIKTIHETWAQGMLTRLLWRSTLSVLNWTRKLHALICVYCSCHSQLPGSAVGDDIHEQHIYPHHVVTVWMCWHHVRMTSHFNSYIAIHSISTLIL